MRCQTTCTLPSNDPDRTCTIARRLGALLRPGDTVLLAGNIGAGKTHFARCLIQSLLPHPEDVPSPTYTLVQTYSGKTGDIWHADLYRLGDPNDVFELGLTDAFDSAICLVEWPDRLGSLAPRGALTLMLAAGDAPDTRILTFSGDHSDWADRLREMANE
jgi:tRNA threonylcarbamoyladenosine biosynthesis protein TsaE